MKTLMKYIFILFMLIWSFNLKAQSVNAFATVKLSTTEVFVKQPIRVTISVHSSTWFADALEFENLSVENSFIVPFTRTVSSIQYINEKKYATLTFYYIVFPYAAGELEVPALNIMASIPPEGDWKGKPVNITTRARKFKVKPVPDSADKGSWMVANNATIWEEWSKPLTEVKVGDVIERTVFVRAFGTLPAFIPDLKWAPTDFASQYPKTADFIDQRNDKEVIGKRVQTVLYLFETEGEFVIPGAEINWWNPWAKQMYSRKTKDISIQVKANPNLGMLTSIKDSLNAENIPVISNVNDEEWWERYLNLKSFITMIIGLAGIWLTVRVLFSLLKQLKQSRHEYLQSEGYAFRKFKKRLFSNNGSIEAYYLWLDTLGCNTFDELLDKQNLILKVDDKILVHHFLNLHLSIDEKSQLLALLMNIRSISIAIGKEELSMNPT